MRVFNKSFLVVSVLAFLLGGSSVGWAFPVTSTANGWVTVHSSQEDLYSTGGTNVPGCVGTTGCPSTNFSFGNISGTVLWEVHEKVFWNEGLNQTVFNYTVFNDTFNDNITSFHVANNGLQAIDFLNGPSGWSFSQTSQTWIWQTNDPASGIIAGQPQDGMSVLLPGLIEVGFGPTVIDFLLPIDDNGCEFDCFERTFERSDTWRVSNPVPEPASLLLLGSGLTGIGFLARRRRKKS